MELLSCDCKKKCEVGTYTCIEMGVRCTDLCRLLDCGNFENNEVDNDVVCDYETDDDD